MKITQRFIDKVKEAIELQNKFENEEFYCGTDDFRWGHAKRDKLDSAISALTEMLTLMFIHDGKDEREAGLLVESLDVIKYSKGLIKNEVKE